MIFLVYANNFYKILLSINLPIWATPIGEAPKRDLLPKGLSTMCSAWNGDFVNIYYNENDRKWDINGFGMIYIYMFI